MTNQFPAAFQIFGYLSCPFGFLFGVNSSIAFLVQSLLMLSESSSVFSYPPSLCPTQHHWQKPELKSC